MRRVLLLISSMLTYNTLAVDIKVKKSENQIENEGSFKDKTIFSEMIKNGDIETT